MVLVDDGTITGSGTPEFHIHPADHSRMITLFDQLDRNGDGTISHIEIIKAMRTDKETLGPILGLESKNIKQEDGTRASFEEVFQSMDGDNDKGVSKKEWLSYFTISKNA